MVDTNNTTIKPVIRKPKNIIYVDASSLRGRFKIGLYDKSNKVKHTLVLGSSIKDINQAERHAVLYGLMYIQKTNNPNRHVLMNDCEGVIEDNQLAGIGYSLNTKLIWIPREINKADKVAKSKINKKKKVWRRLKFFMTIVYGDIPTKIQQVNIDPISDNLSPIAKIVFDDIQESKDRFPMTTADLSTIIIAAFSKGKVELKKGGTAKLRKELSDNHILVIKKKVVMLY